MEIMHIMQENKKCLGFRTLDCEILQHEVPLDSQANCWEAGMKLYCPRILQVEVRAGNVY